MVLSLYLSREMENERHYMDLDNHLMHGIISLTPRLLLLTFKGSVTGSSLFKRMTSLYDNYTDYKNDNIITYDNAKKLL